MPQPWVIVTENPQADPTVDVVGDVLVLNLTSYPASKWCDKGEVAGYVETLLNHLDDAHMPDAVKEHVKALLESIEEYWRPKHERDDDKWPAILHEAIESRGGTVRMFAMLADQATAMGETALCEACIDVPVAVERTKDWAAAADDWAHGEHVDCTGNEVLACQNCGYPNRDDDA